MIESPIVIPEEQVQFLYNFATKADQVNWSAKYRPNFPFLKSLIPYLYGFLDQTIKKVTFDPNNLKAIVGISGGLDSSVSAFLTAETLKRGLSTGTINEASLVLIAFQAMSEEDFETAKTFATDLQTTYPDLPIQFLKRDLTKHLKDLDKSSDDLLTAAQKPKIYSGELTSRLITTMIMEFACKTGHCAIDSTNGSEYILGEIVIGAGEECAPIADFYKSQVYDLAELIGVPSYIINRPPINSTWGHDKVATYFHEIPAGITPRGVYRVLDPILHYLYEKKYKPTTVARLLGHSEEIITNISNRIKAQNHRRDIPYFTVNDRYKRFLRFINSLSNSEVLNFIENCLAVHN